MKRLLIALIVVLSPAATLAAGGGVHLDEAGIDTTDKESLRRGAKMFVDYCLGCHSAKFQRYSRMARDLEIEEEALLSDYMVGVEKPGETMQVAMTEKMAKSWFGTKIPDLSLVARSRGPDWLYTYLRSFYIDEKRPFGVNNALFRGVSMPHVLWELQGWQKAVFKAGPDGQLTDQIERLELVKPGRLSAAEYDAAVRDLVNFLSYVGEPVQNKRRQLGMWVIAFLVVFFILAYLLKKEYWRDVH
ncbi:MAG: cytochrome c1 [Gammaproteobacteria bacterium]